MFAKLHRSLLILALTVPRLAAPAGAAYLQMLDKSKTEEGERHVEQTVTLANNRTEYSLTYDVSVGPDMPPGKCFSHQWVYTIGVPTMGMYRPTTCNWYSQGFFDVLVDGESLRDYLATIKPIRRGGPDACWSATWQTSKGVVRVFFALRGGDDKLLMHIEWETTAPPESVELKLLCYPSFFYGEKDRWIGTATRDVQHTQKVELGLDAEPWVFYCDRGKPRDHLYGACALMCVPGEVTGATVDVQAYPNWTILRFKPDAGQATVALWDFTNVGDNETNLRYLRQSGEPILADLKQAAEANWREPLTGTFELPADRLALYGTQHEFETTPFDRMTPTVETPHRFQAKPLAGGPVKVLVIAPRWAQRETVELAQRMDIEYETVSVSKPDTLFEKRWLILYGSFELYGYRPRTLVAVLDDLRAKLAGDHDCVIVADVRRDIMPDYFLDLLEDKVRDGVGLIATGQAKAAASRLIKNGATPSEFRALVPVEHLPVLRDFTWEGGEGRKPLAKAVDLGKGRVLMLNYPVASHVNLGLTPSTMRALDFVPGDYEHYQSLLAKAVMWVAKRTPAAQITELTSDAVRFNSHSAMSAVQVLIRVHDRAGRPECTRQQELRLPAGETVIPLGMDPRRGDEHFVDVTLSHEGRVVDWASARYETTSSAGIEQVVLDETVLKPGDVVKGRVQLRGIAEEAQLDISIEDSHGRLVSQTRLAVEPKATDVPFALPLHDPLTVAHRVQVTLSDARGARDWATGEVTVPNERLDDFMFLMWSAAQNNQVRSAVLRQMAKHGVDTIDNVGVYGADADTMAAACRNAAWANLRSVPYITRIASKQRTNLVRRPCLTDPAHLSKWADQLREGAKGAAPYGPPAYTLGDENFLVSSRLDVCFSPTCTESFRRYLREAYADLAELNEEWRTDYTSWDQAEPITFDEAKKTKQYARWVDHRRHMERVFTKAHALGRQAIREADPGARVGFDGVFRLDSWHGYDFYQLVRACDLNQVYCLRLNQVEYLRSFRRPDALLGAWHNRIGNADEISAKRVPWHLLFHGFNSSWYWMSYGTGPAAFFPDLRPTPQMRWMEESHNEIKAGIGKLLMNAERLHDGIAIHYSQASVHGNTILDRKLPDAHFGAIFAIEDLGLQYEFVSYEQVEQGALSAYRVLVMPASCAVSDKEVAAIRRFVQEGGLVVADVFPAVMDGHGKPLAKAALDDVFGETVTSTVTATMPEGEVAPLVLKPFDRGRAVLLGYPFSDYRDLRQDARQTGFQEALRKALSAHGIVSSVRVTTEGPPLDVCEVVRFRKGAIGYVGVVKEDNVSAPETRSATVTFPRKSFVYDVRAKKLLGNVDRVQTDIVPGVPRLYAMLPYTVEEVELHSSRPRYRPGEAIELRIRIATSTGRLAGDHVVRVEVTNPQGQTLAHYAQNVLTSQPVATTRVRLALNDPTGEWTLKATEVTSGRQDEIRVSISPER